MVMVLYWSVTGLFNIRELSSLKANYTIVFFTVVNHRNDHKKRTLKHRKKNTKRTEIYQSQTMTSSAR